MLLEKLVSMSLGLILSALLLNSLKGQMTLNRLVAMETKIVESNHLINSLAQQAIRKLDEHRLPLFPKIGKNGEIRYLDGTPHPLMLRTDRIGTHPDSDTLTYLILSRENPTFIRDDGAVCGPLPPHQHALFYDGSALVEGEIIRGEPLLDGCVAITLKPFLKSVLFGGEELLPPIAPPPFLFLRIESVITVYVSRESTLRFLQIQGEEVIENQPLQERAPLIKLEHHTDSVGRYTLSVQKKYDGVPTLYSSKFSTIFQRRDIHSLLLQRQRGRHHEWK